MLDRNILRLCRPPLPSLAIGGTALILLLATACGGTGYAAAPHAAARPVALAVVPLGMTMTPEASTPATVAGNQVAIQNFSFGPQTIAVSAGDTVTWTNSDSVAHTVTAMDGSFASSSLVPGQQFSFTFTTPGTYAYHCSIHPFMTGQVVVQ